MMCPTLRNFNGKHCTAPNIVGHINWDRSLLFDCADIVFLCIKEASLKGCHNCSADQRTRLSPSARVRGRRWSSSTAMADIQDPGGFRCFSVALW
ncbi:hypothetical protein MTO96_014170 [Rhipicephalus appendiculatus]